MAITAELQEQKRLLADKREELALKMDSIKSAPLAQKREFMDNEWPNRESELKKMHDEVVQAEAFDVAQSRIQDEMKASREVVRKVPFSSADAARTAPGVNLDLQPKGLGEMLYESAAYKAYVEGRGNSRQTATEFDSFKSLQESLVSGQYGHEAAQGFDNMKATFASTGLTGYDRQPGVVLQGVQMPRVADLIPQGETNLPTIRYIRETAFVPSATAVAEGGLKPEATLSVGEADAPVRKIAVTLKVTEEMLEDFPTMRDYINQRLPLMVQIEEDNALLNGSGTAPALRGILQTTGILTQAQGFDVDGTTVVANDPLPDPVLRGITRVMAESFFEPTGVVYNPFDWMRVQLLRSGTGDAAGGLARGQYLSGGPFLTGPRTIWGLPVVVTTRIAQKKVLVGAFSLGAQIFRRKGITVEMTNSNENDFVYNRVAIRCEERLALAVYRPQAFCGVSLT